MSAHPIPDEALDDRLSEQRRGTVLERVSSILPAYQIRILEALPRDGSNISKADLAIAIDAGEKSSHFSNSLGALRTLGLVLYPGPGLVRSADWVWK